MSYDWRLVVCDGCKKAFSVLPTKNGLFFGYKTIIDKSTKILFCLLCLWVRRRKFVLYIFRDWGCAQYYM